MDWKSFDKKLLGVVFLALALFATGYWGYNRYVANKQLESELNNRYEYAFQGLNHHIDALESELGVLLISQSTDNASVNLSNVWRSAYSAKEDIGQLPITSDALNNVKYLLADVLKYTNYLDKKIVAEKLTGKEKDIINKFYDQVGVANNNLQDIHSKMDEEKFKWYNKKRVKLNEKKREYSVSPLKGLMQLDKQISVNQFKADLEEVIPNYNQLNQNNVISSLSKVKASSIDEDKAIETTKEFIKEPSKYNYEVREKKGVKLKAAQKARVKIPAYSVKAVHKNRPNEIVYADVSKKGGRVIWLLKKRNLGQKKISREQAEENAAKFVAKNKYDNMEVTSSHSYNDFLIVSLVTKQNEVLIKQDSVAVEVALDNGEVVGFNGIDYVLKHKKIVPNKLKPKLTLADAKEKISSRLKLTKDPQLVFSRLGNKEKLCYEFVGKVKDGPRQDHYRIKINAKTGKEEEVKGSEQDIYREKDSAQFK